MIDQLIESYTKKSTFLKMVIAYNKWWQNGIVITLLAVALVFYTISFINLNLWFGIATISTFAVAGYFANVFNRQTFKRKYEKYDNPSAFTGFNEMILDMFTKEMKDKKFDDKKWDMLQAEIKVEAERARQSIIIYLAGLTTLFLPLWGVYIVKMMGVFEKAPYTLTGGFLTMAALIVVMAVVAVQVAWMRDNILSRYERLIKFNKMITNYRLSQ